MIPEYDLQKQWLIRDKYAQDARDADIAEDMARVQRGEPIDYVIGWRNFLGARIDLACKPLIPREATEFWVEKAIAEINREAHGKTLRILDLFSGSGAIGIAILRHIGGAHVDFGEIDSGFLKQIELNLHINKVPCGSCQVLQSDIFSGISGTYDYIFANPPYLAERFREDIQKSVLDFEPHGALFGGDDGMYFLKKFLADVKNFLTPGGAAYFEFHSPQKEALEILLRDLRYRFTLHKDQFDLYRWGRLGV